MSQFRRFVDEGKLTRINVDRELIEKEVAGAISDRRGSKRFVVKKEV